MIIVTDSSSDITSDEAKKFGIIIVPINATMNGKIYPQETLEQIDNFYTDLDKTKEVPKTSRTPLDTYINIYEKAQENNQDVIVIPLSSGLSSSYEGAVVAANMTEWKNRIFIIDAKQAILSLRIVVEHAVNLRDGGKEASEIVEELNDLCQRVTVYGVIGTLKYLKMGGRIPASLAYIGEKLHIKPLIELRDGKVIEVEKKRGFESAKKSLINKFLKDEFDPDFPVYFGYTKNKDVAKDFMDEILANSNISKTGFFPIGPSIGSHLGSNGLGISYVKRKKWN